MEAEYTLDFVVPIGPTGPSGSSNECFADFNDATQTGILTIKKSYVFPTSVNLYTISNNAVKVPKGIYEFTFCCDLNVTNAASKVVVNVLKNSYGDKLQDMTLEKPESISDMSFSTTNILTLDQDIDLQVKVTNYGHGNILLQHVHVLIKRWIKQIKGLHNQNMN